MAITDWSSHLEAAALSAAGEEEGDVITSLLERQVAQCERDIAQTRAAIDAHRENAELRQWYNHEIGRLTLRWYKLTLLVRMEAVHR